MCSISSLGTKENLQHDAESLISVFNNLFKAHSKTILVSGGDEPIYLPRSVNEEYDKIIFTKDYFSSALHEISHWCIAGEHRRRHIDYGYWYAPDGRTNEQQALFEKVEVKPQALEWIFADAAQHPFNISVDNLNGEAYNIDSFRKRVRAQVDEYLRTKLPVRAKMFRQALSEFYDGPVEKPKTAELVAI